MSKRESFLVADIASRLSIPPEILYMKEDTPPEKRDEINILIDNTTKASLTPEIYSTLKVMIFARPNFAPGAINDKGGKNDSMIYSTRL